MCRTDLQNLGLKPALSGEYSPPIYELAGFVSPVFFPPYCPDPGIGAAERI